MNEIAKVARFPKKNVWYVAPTYRQCKQIIFDILEEQLRRINWVDKINQTDMTFLLKNGSKISLRGADNPDSLRGVGLNFLVLDEFQLIDERAWSEVLRPTLSTTNGSALFIGTPIGTANWAHSLYNKCKDPLETHWSSFSFTTIDGGNVSAEEIEQAKRDLSESVFRQEYLASFESYSNRVYYEFSREHNCKPWTKPIPNTIYVGMDFNVGLLSAAIFAREGNTIHEFDEIALLSSNTHEMVDEIRNRYPTQKIVVYPDPAGSARKTSAASGVTDHTILRNAGFTVKAPRAHNPVRDGINAVNSKLKNALGERTYYVDPKCRKSIESLEKYSYKENSSIPDKDNKYDHFADALRYYVDYDFPVRRDTQDYTPQRFGHAIR